jgi:hypothetical protein
MCTLNDYQTYVINHETGHFLGKGHLKHDNFSGGLVPVMVQQTLGFGDCYPNNLPLKADKNA